MKRTTRSLLLIAMMTISASRLHGEFVTFRFEGTVSEVNFEPWPELSEDALPPVGSAFCGFYRFDSMAVDAASDRYQNSYHTLSPDGGVSVSIGDLQWKAPHTYILTFHDSPSGIDSYEAGDWLGIDLISHPSVANILDRWNFQLRVLGDQNLLSKPLPSIPPSLAAATTATLFMYGDSASSTSPLPILTISASLDSLTSGCDLNHSGDCDASDIDLLTDIVQAGGFRFDLDLNSDTLLDDEDRRVLVEDMMQTFFGDINLDGQVNSVDLNTLALSWRITDATSWSQGDFNGDGNVNPSDLNDLALNWRSGVVAAASAHGVPEPASIGLLLGGFVSLRIRRRRNR